LPGPPLTKKCPRTQMFHTSATDGYKSQSANRARKWRHHKNISIDFMRDSWILYELLEKFKLSLY
jgi:hypothetical protein